MRDALRIRDYRWLAIGLAVSQVGSWAYNVGLVVFVFDQTNSPTWAAAATLGRFLPALVASPYGGVVAERVERRRLMISLDLIATVLMVALGLAAAADAQAIVAIVIAGATSIVVTTYFPATQAMTPQLVGEDVLAAANSVNSVIENVSVILGRAVGAALLAAGPPQVAFFLNAASFLLSAAAVSRIRARSRPSDVTQGGTASVLRQVSTGFRAIASSTTGFVLVLFCVMASFFYGTDTVLFAVVARDKLTGDTNGYGYLLAALGVGGVLGSFLVPRLAQNRRLGLVVTLGMVLYTVPTTVLIGVHSTAAACVLEVLRGIGTIIVDVLAITALQRLMPPDMIARVFGVFMSLVLAAISLGALVTAPLVNRAGLDATLVVFGVGAAALVLLLYPVTARVDVAAARRLRELQPRIDALQMVGVFAGASRTALERLAVAATEEDVPAGTRIIREGDPADAFYVLADGEVRVSARGETGEETELRMMGPGEGFGEIGLLQRVPRTASVDAVTDARLYRIGGEDFLAALSQEPASAAFMEGARTRMALTHPSHEWTEQAEEPAPV